VQRARAEGEGVSSFRQLFKLFNNHIIMLGYTQPNNDVYIFFENDEIQRLAREKIQGIYFNLRDPSKTGLLEASINDEISDRMKTSARKNDEGFMEWLLLEMRSHEYDLLIERGGRELHEGYRHICLLDASKLDDLNFGDRTNYRQLKHWESQHSRSET